MKDIYLHLAYIKNVVFAYFQKQYTNTTKIITYRKEGGDRKKGTEIDTRFL